MKLKVHFNGLPLPDLHCSRQQRQTLIKYLIAMKLFFTILIFSLNVSANVYSQKVNLSVSGSSLQDVMKQIRKQTGHYFMYTSSILKDARPVSVNIKNAELNDALQVIFKDQPYTYTIQDDAILIKRKPAEKSVVDKVIDFYSAITIRGKVVDENGAPLPGATVRASGKVAITDVNGEFILNGVDQNANVEVSYLGYKIASLLASSSFMNFRMEMTSGVLSETTIKGYYNTTRAFNTGNVSGIKSTDIEKQPVGDPVATLQGKIPGLYIQQFSGAPGRAFNIRLRGQNSIANGNDPLFIVNGIPYGSKPLTNASIAGGAGGFFSSPFNDLNPADIESITVLKDADATAIYGSRGANGVILITTKKGEVGKAELSANVYAGAGNISRKMDLLKTDEYLKMRHEAFANDNVTPGTNDNDINGKYDQTRYTDWQDVLIGNTAHVYDAQLSISGGSNLTQFRLSGGYRNETTVYPGDFRSQRGSGLISINHKSENQKLRLDFTANYIAGINNLPQEDVTRYILLAPNAPAIYDEKGQLNWASSNWDNPFGLLRRTDKQKTNNLVNNLVADYEVLRGLNIKSNFGYHREELTQSLLTPFSSYDPAIVNNPAFARQNTNADTKVTTWIIEPQLTYHKKIGSGTLDALIGSTFQQTNREILVVNGTQFSDDAVISNLLAASNVSIVENSLIKYKYNAFFARVGYNLLDKYIINLTGRRDGSSRFGPGKQFGSFGAAGAAWLFHKETFIANALPFLSYGKIRGSYGTTGNDQLTDYKYLSTYSASGVSYQDVGGLYPTQLTNPQFGWERVNKIEFALELGFLKDRILLNTSLYRNRTSNQLVGYALPNITGFNNIQANLPAVIENRGIEFELNTVNIDKGQFSWSTNFNISIPRNKLVSYPNIAGSSYATRYVVGQPLFIAFRYDYTGIDKGTGLYTFRDLNADGLLTSSKDRIPTFIGQKFFGGFSNTFRYKNWQLDILASFTKQTGRNYLFNVMPGAYNAGLGNQPKAILSDDRQPFSQDYGSLVYKQSSLFDGSNARVTDASYVRIRNVSLSYSFPAEGVFKVLKRARLYASAQNLFTITKYKGFDPEAVLESPQLAPLRMVTAGLQFSL